MVAMKCHLKECALAVAVSGLWLLLSGCSADARAGATIFDVADSSAVVTVREAPTTCKSCLRLAPTVRLGEAEGYLQATRFAALDSSGRLWVSSAEGPLIYDGNALKAVGGTGDGPGEFQGPGQILVDGARQVHVLDRRNARETVMSEELSAIATYMLPGDVSEAVYLTRDSKAMHMTLLSDRDIGLPLHVVDGVDVVASFGLPPDGFKSIHLPKRLAAGADGRLFAAEHFAYDIEVWTASGRRVVGLHRPGVIKPLPEGPRPLLKGTEPMGLLTALRVDARRRLWVSTWIPQADWADHVEEVEYPGATILIPTSNGDLYDGMVDVIDLRDGRLIASQRSASLVSGFLNDSTAFGNDFTPEGAPVFTIWSLSLDTPR